MILPANRFILNVGMTLRGRSYSNNSSIFLTKSIFIVTVNRCFILSLEIRVLAEFLLAKYRVIIYCRLKAYIAMTFWVEKSIFPE